MFISWSKNISCNDSLCFPSGILQGIFYGLGNGGGTVLSGHLYHAVGAQRTFQYFAISSLVVLLLLLVFFPIADGCVARSQQKDAQRDHEYEPVATDYYDEAEPTISSKNVPGKSAKLR